MNKPDIATIAKLIQTDAFERIGQHIPIDPALSADDFRGHFRCVGTIQLAPSQCGPVGQMFSTILVEVSAGLTPNAVQMLYAYRYVHPSGGSNGYKMHREIMLPEYAR